MSSDLKTSAALAKAPWFVDVIRAAMIEQSVAVITANPNDKLAKAIIADPNGFLPMVVHVVADNSTVSAPDWQNNYDVSGDGDIRYIVAQAWAVLTNSAVPRDPDEPVTE